MLEPNMGSLFLALWLSRNHISVYYEFLDAQQDVILYFFLPFRSMKDVLYSLPMLQVTASEMHSVLKFTLACVTPQISFSVFLQQGSHRV